MSTGPTNKINTRDTESNNQVNAAQKHGVKIGWQLYRNLATQQEIALMQFDVFAARKIIVLKNALLPKKMPNAQTGGAHATVYRGCPVYQHKSAEASMKINEHKVSAVANKLNSPAKTDLKSSTEKLDVLVVEVLTKI